jgi:hypothetical protein
MINKKSKVTIEKLFSSSLFKDMDVNSLLEMFSISSTIRKNNQEAKPKESYFNQVESNIRSIPPEGIIISSPGEYQFTDDIIWMPNASSSAAISILANDVVLNLNGFTLTVVPPASRNGLQLNGIRLGISDHDYTTCDAIIIKNGKIDGATYYGVSVFQSTNIEISNITVKNINYNETSKPGLTACGIFIDSSENFNVINCFVQNMNVEAPSCAGIQIISSINGNVSGCGMQDFFNSDGGVQGFSYIESSNITTDSCYSERFRSQYKGLTQTTGHTVIGYVPILCTNLEFNNCTTDSMTGCCDDCHGFSVFLNSYVSVNNFKATNITDGDCSRNTGAKATGLEVYGDYIKINNCTVENIFAIVPQDLQSAGFSAWGNKITFNNCEAKNVKVLDANRQPSTQFGYGTGYGWAPDPRQEFCGVAANIVQYNSCTAHDCQLGFDTWSHTDSQWNNVMSYNCPIFILAEPYGTTRNLSMDKCSESPNELPQTVVVYNLAENNTYPKLHH